MFTNQEDKKKRHSKYFFTTRCGLLQMNYLTETSRETRNKHRRIRTDGSRWLFAFPFVRLFIFCKLRRDIGRPRQTKLKVSRNESEKNIRRNALLNAIKSDSDRIKSAYIRWLTYRCGLFPSARRFLAILESDWWFFYVLANSYN